MDGSKNLISGMWSKL